MTYLKATLVGSAMGIVAAIAWVGAVVFLPLLVGTFLSYVDGEGGFVSTGNVNPLWILMAGIIGFAAGFAWTLRRARRLLR